ncbi:MAG: signal peptide peptidase SppA [Candidatus Aminicenantes bacterium]|nr:signal peptide peptidase SppA [Candidatus Aminicenantes bacterium]
MSDDKKGFFERLHPLWQGINLFRLVVLNVVFFVLLAFVLGLLWNPRPNVPGSTVLVVKPYGAIVEQLSAGGLTNAAGKIIGLDTGPETLLKDLVDAVDMAGGDSRVKVLLLDLNGLTGAGLVKLQEIRDAVIRFKKTGKKVIAVADNYIRSSYYLAAYADEIYMHHMGLLLLEGYSSYGMFFKEGLDKLEVDVNVFRVGKYKSAVEPFLRNDMSEEAKEAELKYLENLWETYLQDVAAGRGVKVETIKNFVEQFPTRVKEFEGDIAQAALKAGLIDYAVSRDQVRDRLIKLVGEDKSTHTYYQVGYGDYLEALDRDAERWGDNVHKNAVAVIVAKGNILNGRQPPGNIGGDSTAALIREARHDKNVKAILLRVDSGGGSSFASEVIRRELELAHKEGKPVVVSMSSMAASGGYWIALASDEVWAYPATLTGSIGIFGIFPTYQKTMAKYLGTRVDGVGTNKLSGALRFDRAISPEVAEIIQAVVDKGYKDFITTVAGARKTTPEKIHEIAQGRIWSGKDALELGLVDRLGGLEDALKSAAKLAKLGDNFGVKYFRKKPGAYDRLIANLFSKITAENGSTAVGGQGNQPLNPVNNMLRLVNRQMQMLSQFNDPNGLYAYWPYSVE